jgi:dihydrofolate reductase
MAKIVVFNSVTLDGYFTDKNGDMSWAHKSDPEWDEFVSQNASGEGALLFGRITYELMASYWPTPQAMETDPAVAEGMNKLPKIVFSRTLNSVSWKNTKLVKADLAGEVRKMKQQFKDDITILGSGTIVSQLTQERLIDEYDIVLLPIILGSGRTMFEGVKDRPALKLTKTRSFKNGNVLLCYEPYR